MSKYDERRTPGTKVEVKGTSTVDATLNSSLKRNAKWNAKPAIFSVQEPYENDSAIACLIVAILIVFLYRS